MDCAGDDDAMTTQAQVDPRFWGTLSPEEWQIVFQTGRLDAKLTARLWRMRDRQDPPPDSVEILLHKSDFEKMLRRLKRKQALKDKPL
jgi:hypothetical protein